MTGMLGRAALSLACRFSRGGVIINEHTLGREELRSHVDALSRWFEFIHPDELPGRVSAGARGRKPFCLLTFDDGHRSNATVAAPELARLGVPASFLVVTGFVGTESVLWFTLYARLRRKLGAALPAGLAPGSIKRLPHDILVERLERACREHGVAADFSDEDVVPMTWDQARALRRQGFDVGAHGVSHAILTRQTREEALANISGSIARVSAEMGSPCRTFAFPNGNYTAELALHAASCGARLVFTAEPTWFDERFPLWRLPRVQLFGGHDRRAIELKLAAAAAGCLVPSGDGTGLAYRSVNALARRASPKGPPPAWDFSL
jgi:peptidoglycan/xylan/chitin deacetylase (PgdA/CDA1 family)